MSVFVHCSFIFRQFFIGLITHSYLESQIRKFADPRRSDPNKSYIFVRFKILYPIKLKFITLKFYEAT
jgi:hypothetical protein